MSFPPPALSNSSSLFVAFPSSSAPLSNAVSVRHERTFLTLLLDLLTLTSLSSRQLNVTAAAHPLQYMYTGSTARGKLAKCPSYLRLLHQFNLWSAASSAFSRFLFFRSFLLSFFSFCHSFLLFPQLLHQGHVPLPTGFRSGTLLFALRFARLPPIHPLYNLSPLPTHFLEHANQGLG